ncbi:hypothetical protein Q3W71_17165 [Micromonospora sp. C28SCA-DRY-2]|uniref:hypothetical protein n=1 Tax=Micromonospora sp. C28SCA-DRY-2 TaxID=3059522 RepID=UPI0026763964|nr:hypothetical protein [Micromonospora sp. C28SCA-DRY-2]MDO3703405.1 hypothetical protein [Micromonospora sp. C28SCA-DRY-2]
MMLMIAAPLLGLGGALIGLLQTFFGAIFVLIAGIGIGYRPAAFIPADIARDAATASLATPPPTTPTGPTGPLPHLTHPLLH